MSDIVKICKIHGKLVIGQCSKETKKLTLKSGKISTCISFYCRKCRTITQTKWQKNNPDKVKKYQEKTKNHKDYASRNRICFIKMKYRMTLEHYERLLKEQNSVCAICKEPDYTIEGNSMRLKGLSIDHDHKTNEIRGLLCNRCNPMLGYAKDTPEVLEAAAKYLRSYQKP